jgi:hypothetical protein
MLSGFAGMCATKDHRMELGQLQIIDTLSASHDPLESTKLSLSPYFF